MSYPTNIWKLGRWFQVKISFIFIYNKLNTYFLIKLTVYQTCPKLSNIVDFYLKVIAYTLTLDPKWVKTRVLRFSKSILSVFSLVFYLCVLNCVPNMLKIVKNSRFSPKNYRANLDFGTKFREKIEFLDVLGAFWACSVL